MYLKTSRVVREGLIRVKDWEKEEMFQTEGRPTDKRKSTVCSRTDTSVYLEHSLRGRGAGNEAGDLSQHHLMLASKQN